MTIAEEPTPAPEGPEELTPSKLARKTRNRRIARDIVNGVPPSQALQRAGLKSLPKDSDFRDYVRGLLDQVGVNDLAVASVLADGLQADRVFYDQHGTAHKDPDFNVRHKYLETAVRLRGIDPPKRKEVHHTGGVVIRGTPSLGTGGDWGAVVDGEYTEVEEDDEGDDDGA